MQELIGIVCSEILCNGHIIIANNIKSLGCKISSLCQGGSALLFPEDFYQWGIVGLRCNDHQVAEVFGGSPDHGWPANIYFLNDEFFFC